MRRDKQMLQITPGWFLWICRGESKSKSKNTKRDWHVRMESFWMEASRACSTDANTSSHKAVLASVEQARRPRPL